MEHWKPIKGYEDYYLVSNKGNVKSIRSRKLLKPRAGKAKKPVRVYDLLTIACDMEEELREARLWKRGVKVC